MRPSSDRGARAQFPDHLPEAGGDRIDLLQHRLDFRRRGRAPQSVETELQPCELLAGLVVQLAGEAFPLRLMRPVESGQDRVPVALGPGAGLRGAAQVREQQVALAQQRLQALLIALPLGEFTPQPDRLARQQVEARVARGQQPQQDQRIDALPVQAAAVAAVAPHPCAPLERDHTGHRRPRRPGPGQERRRRLAGDVEPGGILLRQELAGGCVGVGDGSGPGNDQDWIADRFQSPFRLHRQRRRTSRRRCHALIHRRRPSTRQRLRTLNCVVLSYEGLIKTGSGRFRRARAHAGILVDSKSAAAITEDIDAPLTFGNRGRMIHPSYNRSIRSIPPEPP